jgi:hypothetical protein
VSKYKEDVWKNKYYLNDSLINKDIRGSTIYAKISSRRRSQYLNELEKAREIAEMSY